MTRRLVPKPLTAEAFAPHGDVIEAAEGAERRRINEGHTTRFHDLARLELTREGGRPLVSIFRSEPLPRPITIRLMERHPLSSQAFFPLSGRPYLVVVGGQGELNTGRIEAFTAAPHQGVNYAPGTWHHYSLALEGVSDFLIIDRGGPGDDLDEIRLAPKDQIVIEV